MIDTIATPHHPCLESMNITDVSDGCRLYNVHLYLTRMIEWYRRMTATLSSGQFGQLCLAPHVFFPYYALNLILVIKFRSMHAMHHYLKTYNPLREYLCTETDLDPMEISITFDGLLFDPLQVRHVGTSVENRHLMSLLTSSDYGVQSIRFVQLYSTISNPRDGGCMEWFIDAVYHASTFDRTHRPDFIGGTYVSNQEYRVLLTTPVMYIHSCHSTPPPSSPRRGPLSLLANDETLFGMNLDKPPLISDVIVHFPTLYDFVAFWENVQ